jgi:hypothetical protein
MINSEIRFDSHKTSATDSQGQTSGKQGKYAIVFQASLETIDRFSVFAVIVGLCVLTHCIFQSHELIVTEAV